MTIFGGIWVLLCFTSLFYQYKFTFFLLLLSCAFQAAAIANFGGKGITPLFFTELVIITRCLFIHKSVKFKYNNWVKLFFIFTIFSSIMSIVLPIVFKGVNVYSQKLGGIDPNFFAGGSPLSFGASNIAQIVFLIVNFVTVYLVYINKWRITNDYLWSSILGVIIIVLSLGFWEYFSKSLKLNVYPFSIFNSNEGYALLYDIASQGRSRLSATFAEPSMAGAFLAPSFWGLYSINTLKTKMLSSIVLLALFLNLSGTGLGAFLCGSLIYIYFKGCHSIVKILLMGIFLLTVLISLGFLNFVTIMVNSKFQDNQSGFIRLGADFFTLNLLYDNYGLGVGLGSHRTSGFLINLLGAVGVLGIVFFTRFMIHFLAPAFKNRDSNKISLFISFFSVCLFVAQFLAIPDLTFPIMWFWMFAMATLNLNDLNVKYEIS